MVSPASWPHTAARPKARAFLSARSPAAGKQASGQGLSPQDILEALRSTELLVRIWFICSMRKYLPLNSYPSFYNILIQYSQS